MLEWANLVKRNFLNGYNLHFLPIAWSGKEFAGISWLWLRNLSPLELWEGGTGSVLDATERGITESPDLGLEGP